MSERLTIKEQEDPFSPMQRFERLDEESRALVLQAFGLDWLNPKTLIECHKSEENRVTIRMSQPFAPEPTGSVIGNGEIMYVKPRR